MQPLFYDTTCNKDGMTTYWEAMYNLLEEENPRPLETKTTIGATKSSDASYFEAACSFLHRIVSGSKILPYTNMLGWIIDEVDVSDRTFRKSRQDVMGSFKPDNLIQMYHLPQPKKIYDKAFIDNFTKENEAPMDVMQNWRSGSNKFRWEKIGMYPIAPLSAPQNFAAVMLCRLFRKYDTTKFSIEWVPLIDAIVNSTILN